MKKFLKDLDPKWKTYAVAGSVCVILFVVLNNLGKVGSALGIFFSAFSSVFFGFIIAYIINPIAKFFRRTVFKWIKKESIAWPISVVISLVLVIAFLIVLISMLIPQLYTSGMLFMKNLDKYIANVKLQSEKFDPMISSAVNSMIDYYYENGSGFLSNISNTLITHMGSLLNKTFSVGSDVLEWVIGFIIAIYFLIAKKTIQKTIARFFQLALTQEESTRFFAYMTKFNSIFSKYIMYELLDGLIIGVLTALFMTLLGMPNVVLVSVVCAVTNLIPNFGPFIGGAVGALILFVASPSSVIPFLIFTIVIQQLDGYVLKPKLFGDALNVSGVIILLFVVVLGNLLGIYGMLLAIPIAGVVCYLYSNAFLPWLEERHERIEAEEPTLQEKIKKKFLKK